MKALVISGGGSKGAFAGGLAEYLITVCKQQYKIFIGSSTGSLLVPLLSIGEIEKLKIKFTSVTQDDIFNNCPFFLKKVKGQYKTKINHLGIFKCFQKEKNLMERVRTCVPLFLRILRKLILRRFDKMMSSLRLSNLITMQVKYKEAKDCTYKEFCEWIWASAPLVPFKLYDSFISQLNSR